MLPSVAISLRCRFIHHGNPYLLLGPFKFELLHQEPEIGLLHEFAHPDEMMAIRYKNQKKMHATPYVSKGRQGTSKERTSKVFYINEMVDPEAMPLSKRIELVTRLSMRKGEKFHVMNYGIGGKITPHFDTAGINYGNGTYLLLGMY